MTAELDDPSDLLLELNQMRLEYGKLKARFDALMEILYLGNCWLHTRDGFIIPYKAPKHAHHGLLELRMPLRSSDGLFYQAACVTLPSADIKSEFRKYVYKGCNIEKLPVYEEV